MNKIALFLIIWLKKDSLQITTEVSNLQGSLTTFFLLVEQSVHDNKGTFIFIFYKFLFHFESLDFDTEM